MMAMLLPDFVFRRREDLAHPFQDGITQRSLDTPYGYGLIEFAPIALRLAEDGAYPAGDGRDRIEVQ